MCRLSLHSVKSPLHFLEDGFDYVKLKMISLLTQNMILFLLLLVDNHVQVGKKEIYSGVAQIVVRRLAVGQARVRISA